jgi:ribonuclease E
MTDISASTSHAPEAAPAGAEVIHADSNTTIDFRAHLDVSPKIEPVAQVQEEQPAVSESALPESAEQHVVVKTEHAAEADAAPIASPAQGDLLAHAGLSQQQVEEPTQPNAAEVENGDDVKKDASSHG